MYKMNSVPKFLRVNNKAVKDSANPYLLRPWIENEIVKVHDNQKFEQIGSEKIYVRVVRKDETGKWTNVVVESKSFFDNLNNKK